MKNQKKKGKNNYIVPGTLIALICVIVIATCIFTPRKFDSAATVLKAIDENCMELEYSELNSQLVVTKNNRGGVILFKVTEEGFLSLSLRLMRERGWVFESWKVPAGDGNEEYKVHRGTRGPE